MSLEAASDARKAKLQALRRRKEQEEAGITPSNEGLGGGADLGGGRKEKIKFRNYDPLTGTAKKPQLDALEDTVEKEVMGVQEEVLREDEVKRKEELDIFNIAPKKPNWDLKRDLEKRLAKLEPKTKQAIYVLIRKRLAEARGREGGGGEAEIAAAVGAGDELMEDADESDEE